MTLTAPMSEDVVCTQNTSNSECGWPHLSTSKPFARDSLLSHFLDSLLVRVRLLRQLVESGSFEEEILAEVRNQLANFHCPGNMQSSDRKNCAWTEAYRIELLLLLAVPRGRLVPELEYRLSLAEDLGVRGTARLRKVFQQVKASASDTSDNKQTESSETNVVGDARFLLVEVVKGIHRTLIKKYLSRKLLKDATRNIVFAALLSFLIFMLPYLLLFFDYYRSPTFVDRDIHQWVGFPLLTCVSAGLFGSYFSRLLYIQKNSRNLSYDELLSTRDMFAIIVRGAVGVCGAALLYFFLHSEVITGPLIPDFKNFAVKLIQETPQYPRLLIANKDLALLIVWGFLAGFSERLVPSILATTEGRLATSGGKIDNAAKKPRSLSKRRGSGRADRGDLRLRAGGDAR